MIRTFEIFTETYSEIVQAPNMVMAIQTFFGKIEASPMPLIISIDDVTFREGKPSLAKRKLALQKFREKYKIDIDFLADIPDPHTTGKGRELILIARTELNYSPKTSSCDILRTILI